MKKNNGLLNPFFACYDPAMSKALSIVLLFGIGLFGTACANRGASPSSGAIDPNKYYAVLLSNNAVYFGKLQGLDTAFPVLTDVFYIQTSQNPETKAVSNVLIKRGKELHAPDRMILNERSIVFVEPVGADSQVAKLIAESKK
jgi:small nuclear ribonucleoprotein (snRNP)-like protein